MNLGGCVSIDLTNKVVFNKNNSSLVTIYMPTYNRLGLLKRAVSSVLSQTYKDLELLIVDDGSTDGTSEYLEALSSVDSRVVVLQKEGARGAPSSRNLAISNAKGKYITGLDDDDYFKENHIEKLLDAYHPSCSFVFARHHNWKDIIFSPLFYLTKKVSFKQLAYFNIVGNQVFTETWKLKEVDGFDVNLPAAQDYETWLRLTSKYGLAKVIYSDTYVLDLEHGMGRITDNIKSKLVAYQYIEAKHRFCESFLLRDAFYLRKASAGDEFSYFRILRCSINPNNYRHSMSFFKNVINKKL